MHRRGTVLLAAALGLAVALSSPLPAPPAGAAEVGASPLKATDVGQYFDRFSRTPGEANYADNSSHPLRGLTTTDNALLFGGMDCLRCHYGSGGSARRSDECLKCHFEAQPNAPAPNHGNGKIELAVPKGDALPTAQAKVTSLAEYDEWCLSCHRPGSTTTLGNLAARGKTAIHDNAFARSRHRNLAPRHGGPAGCIHCHAPHGAGNTRLVRENPLNRRAAGGVPMRFGTFPNDNLGTGGYGRPQSVPYRSRTEKNLADADDDYRYCDTACHRGRKDHVVARDNQTGRWLLSPGRRIVHVIGETEYTIDNIADAGFFHAHASHGIIPTDNMVTDFAAAAGISGPSFFHYPGREESAPSSYGAAQNAASPIPFFPDFRDGDRDYPNGYLDQGPIRYRYSCSTCHDPHGTTLPNSDPSGMGYPDLRLPRKAPNELCRSCH